MIGLYRLGMTFPSGRLDFEADIKEVGGMTTIARTNYARNMYLIMKTFHQLPSRDGTFKTLTMTQVDFLLTEWDLDIKEAEAEAKGNHTEEGMSFFDDDDSWWNNPETIANEEESDEEVEDTRKQVLALSDEETQRTISENLAKLRHVYSRNAVKSDADRARDIVQDRIKDMYKHLDKETYTKDTGNSSHASADDEDILRRLNGDD